MANLNCNLIPFEFETYSIRVVISDGQTWFCARDVAVALDYANPSQAYKTHCKSLTLFSYLKCRELGWENPNPQGVYFILEPDVYRLIVKSTKPEAERFESWIFEDVLPEIRRKGSYQANFSIPKSFAEALQLAADQARQIEEQQKQIEAAKPMIQFHEEVTAGEGEFSIPQACKTLFDGAVTETQLRAWLKHQGWMDRRKGFNEPTVWAIRQGYMRLKLNMEVAPGIVKNYPVITPKGLTLLRHLYRTGDLFIATIPVERRLSAPELRV